VQREIEAIWIAGFGKQLPGSLQISRWLKETRVVVRHKRRHHALHWRGKAARDLSNDVVVRNRIRKCFTHQGIVERFGCVIEANERELQSRLADDFQVLVLSE